MNDLPSRDGPFAGSAEGLKVAAKTGETAPYVWLLLGARRGDNNQLRALAEALGLPFETKSLTYNSLRHVPFLREFGLTILTGESRRLIRPPWPQLVISVAYSGLSVARFIRRQSGGRTRLVHVGNPRISIDDLDLVMITPQFIRKESPNVLALPFPIGNPAQSVTATNEEEEWLRPFPRPRRLVAVGGSTRKWKIDNSELDRAIQQLQGLCESRGGSVIAVTSPRTTLETRRRLEARLARKTDALVDSFPRFAVLLARCDEFYVTADSVSMLSEAVLTGKPVGMIPVARSLKGSVSEWIRRRVWRFRSHADLSRFWHFLTANNLVGTVDRPIASHTTDTVAKAVDAVRRVIE